MRQRLFAIAILLSLVGFSFGMCREVTHDNEQSGDTTEIIAPPDTNSVTPSTDSSIIRRDKLPNGYLRVRIDTLLSEDSNIRYSGLSDTDYQNIAKELGIEVATIKAVVSIEAGPRLEGFLAPGVPVINFDRKMYNSIRNKATSGKKVAANTKIPDGITSSYGKKEWGELIAARKINEDRANMGTFWGMFQIGGFNYKLCGCTDIDEFVKLMSHSEYMQLELFAAFVTNTGMVKHLRNRNWSAFARMYNGASYAKRGYHTRMANAYKKFK